MKESRRVSSPKLHRNQASKLIEIGQICGMRVRQTFLKSIGHAIEGYLAVRETPPQHTKRHTANLLRAIGDERKGKKGALRDAIKALPADMKANLDNGGDKGLRRFGLKESPDHIEALLVRNLVVAAPRTVRVNRQGRAKRHVPVMLRGAARVKHGNPTEWPEFLLGLFVLDAWRQATGKKLPRIVRSADEGRNVHPAVALLGAILNIVQYSEHSAITIYRRCIGQMTP